MAVADHIRDATSRHGARESQPGKRPMTGGFPLPVTSPSAKRERGGSCPARSIVDGVPFEPLRSRATSNAIPSRQIQTIGVYARASRASRECRRAGQGRGVVPIRTRPDAG